jgi:PAS domain S-box-containing protein
LQGTKGTSSYTLAADPPAEGWITYEAVFYPVLIGDTHWSVIVATPRQEILGTLQTFRRDLTIIFGILVASLFFFTYYIVRARGILREEKKRKEAETALRESERSYRDILENMQDVFYRTDTANNLTMISPSGVKLLGYASETEVLGRNITHFYASPEDREVFLRALQENGIVNNFEIRLRRSDGSIFTVLANSHRYTDAAGNVLGIEGIIRDITERKRTEVALQQATRKLNLLTVITTNNIRNAVFTLSGYLELEQRQADEAKRREYHEKEVALLHQVNLWLNTAKSYQDLGLYPPRWHSVNTTFILALSHLDMTSITRTLEVDGLEIYADPLLEIVFFNLAENVLTHATTATRFTVTFEEHPGGLTLIVEDNGKGIPADLKQTIFEREFTPAKGVGLFMAREILEITGISIRETGTWGKGARFEMVIPPEGYRFTTEKEPT